MVLKITSFSQQNYILLMQQQIQVMEFESKVEQEKNEVLELGGLYVLGTERG